MSTPIGTVSTLKKFLRAPMFPDSFEKARVAQLLNHLVLSGIGICLLGLAAGVPFFFSHRAISAGLVAFFLCLCLVSWVSLRRGNLSIASAVLVASIHLIVVSNSAANGGIESKDNLFYAVPVVVSPLLLSFRWALVSALVALAELSAFALLGFAGVHLPRILPGVPLGVWFLGALILALLFQAVRLSVDGWNRAIHVAEHELAERKRTESERDGLREALFQAQKMESLGRMAGGVAHDFNNLLMVVTGNLELVKELPNLDESLRNEIAQTEKVLQSAYQLNRGLMDFSKKRELRLERLPLDTLLTESLPVLSQLLGRKGRLETDLNAGDARILADRTGMNQVLQNLVVNAKDAMDGGGTVTLRTTTVSTPGAAHQATAGAYLRLSVHDTGCGMDAATKVNIFEPFFTTKQNGTGLGLATVFGMVKQLGGFIEVDSVVGQGTEFRIFLPLA